MEIKKQLGKRIKELRLKHEFTQEQLGEKIGLQSQTVSQLERGETFLSCDVLEKLCLVFDVTPKYIFDFNYEKTTQKDLITQIVEMLKENPQRINDAHKIISALVN